MQRKFRLIPLILVLATLVTALIREYIRNGTRRWFSDDLPAPEIVRQWSEDELDQSLYKLSRWEEFTPAQFRSFVEHQISGLGLKKTDKFHYLEVGVGVGAFARYILQNYPNVTGMGIDLEPNAIAVAAEVLPSDRMHLLVANMVEIPADSNSFDYVLVAGSLCYLHSLHDVQCALAEFARVLKTGGGVCASMLASATSEMGSCNIRIPKSTWGNDIYRALGLKLVTMEEMNDWKLPHAFGRYATCLRKT
jgi:SAM-dependent methyltransferase